IAPSGRFTLGTGEEHPSLIASRCCTSTVSSTTRCGASTSGTGSGCGCCGGTARRWSSRCRAAPPRTPSASPCVAWAEATCRTWTRKWLSAGSSTAQTSRAQQLGTRRTTSAWTSRAPMRGPSMARASTWRRMSDEYGEGPTGRAGEEEQGERAESHAARAERRPPPNAPLPPLQRNSAMIVCRALLGKVRYSDEEKPSADDIQRTCLGKDPAYDCVLGDRRKIHGTFREFVLYHDDQVYPEFIVVYQRVFFHERFQEIFEHMVERCRQRQFHGPTQEEEKVLRSLWDHYAMPHKGRIDKWQLLDLLKAINQPPENEEGDLDETFREINTSGTGRISWEEFLAEMTERVHNSCR
ncbi:unnamed protein product, partial [Effrenium voratum]